MLDATFDLNDFVNQSELITNMRSFAGVAKMILGIACQIKQIKSHRLRKDLKRIWKDRKRIRQWLVVGQRKK